MINNSDTNLTKSSNYISKGTLKFTGKPIITPIIECFFGPWNNDLFEVGPDNTVLLFGNIAFNFNAISNRLNDNAQKLGVFDGIHRSMSEWIHLLSDKYRVSFDALCSEDEMYDMDISTSDASIDVISSFAFTFNDGHNLH